MLVTVVTKCSSTESAELCGLSAVHLVKSLHTRDYTCELRFATTHSKTSLPPSTAHMMPQGLPCLCQPAITGMAGGGAQVCGGDAAHTKTRACCRASLLVVKGDREVRDTTSVLTPQGRQLEHKGADTARLAARCRFTANWRLSNAPSPNPAPHAHKGGEYMQAACKQHVSTHVSTHVPRHAEHMHMHSTHHAPNLLLVRTREL
jgi:hypothetical protein